MSNYEALHLLIEFESLAEQISVDPMGIDPTLESVAALYSRWREIRRLGFEIDPDIEKYLLRVSADTDALNAEGADCDPDYYELDEDRRVPDIQYSQSLPRYDRRIRTRRV